MSFLWTLKVKKTHNWEDFTQSRLNHLKKLKTKLKKKTKDFRHLIHNNIWILFSLYLILPATLILASLVHHCRLVGDVTP